MKFQLESELESEYADINPIASPIGRGLDDVVGVFKDVEVPWEDVEAPLDDVEAPLEDDVEGAELVNDVDTADIVLLLDLFADVEYVGGFGTKNTSEFEIVALPEESSFLAIYNVKSKYKMIN